MAVAARGFDDRRPPAPARTILAGLAVLSIATIAWLCVNHWRFPLFLDLMEGTVLQHVQRLAAGEAVYPAPTPDFVALAYNPLYYVLALPFTWILGLSVPTLRLVAVLGYLVSGVVIYHVVRRHTGSAWWGLMAAGLFAAAYSVMDVYLDTAHSDSWLIATALLGSDILGRSRSRAGTLAGILLLVSSFWFKQHGALFAIGGALFLTWRDGPWRALPAWLVAALLGPGLYVFGGPALFGSHFHYFTWTVPSGWTEVTLRTFKRYFGYNGMYYPVLAPAALYSFCHAALDRRARLSIWHVQFVFAVLSGFMGALDSGSSYNVYIPMGTLFIVVGTIGLHELVDRPDVRRYHLQVAGLVLSFATLAYNPFRVSVSSRADGAYADLVQMLRGLGGTVYAPSLGQLEKDFAFHPAAHWVALEDLIRGPGLNTRNHPVTRRLLEPALQPAGSAFILANYRLEEERFPKHLRFMLHHYVLDRDLGDRFEPLRCLPKRYDNRWPRYLYRHAPSGTDTYSARP